MKINEFNPVEQKELEPMEQFAGFYPLIKDELEYQHQCEMTSTWY
jgi:hypothetical protein